MYMYFIYTYTYILVLIFHAVGSCYSKQLVGMSGGCALVSPVVHIV